MFSQSKPKQVRRAPAEAQFSSSHRTVQIGPDRNFSAANPRDARYAPPYGPQMSVFHEEDRHIVNEARYDRQNGTVIPPLLHGQATHGHYENAGPSTDPPPFGVRNVDNWIPAGYVWDSHQEKWVVPPPISANQPVGGLNIRPPTLAVNPNPFLSMFGAPRHVMTGAVDVHADDGWLKIMQTYWSPPDGMIGRYHLDGTELVNWMHPREVPLGSYVVAPSLAITDLRQTLAHDVHADPNEHTILGLSNPFFLKASTLSLDSSGQWYRCDQAKDRLAVPGEQPLFRSRSVRLPQAYAGRILVLTTAGTQYAFPDGNKPSGVEGNHEQTHTHAIRSYNGRGAVSQIPSGRNSGSQHSPPQQQVLFTQNPRVNPDLVTEYPTDPNSSDEEDDDEDVDEHATMTTMTCATNGDVTLVQLNKQHDHAQMREHMEQSCFARNVCSPDIVERITDRRLLALLKEDAIAKYVKAQGTRSSNKDASINKNFATLKTLALMKSPSVLHTFYKTFFAVDDSNPLKLDPEGIMLAYFHPAFDLKKTDAMTFFDSNMFDTDSVELSRHRVMEAVKNLKPACTYLMWDVWEKLLEEIDEIVSGRLVASFYYPPSYVAHHLHLLLAKFAMEGRYGKTSERWDQTRLRRRFRRFVTDPFRDSTLATEVYAALSQFYLQGTSVSSTRKSPRATSTIVGVGADGTSAKKAKTKAKKKSPATQTPNPQPVPVVPPTPNPPPAPTAAPVVHQPPVYCRLHLLNVLGLQHPNHTSYVCKRAVCRVTGSTAHSAITVSSSSTKKELEDFLATQLSLDTWHDRTTDRIASVQYDKILQFVAGQP